MLRHSLGQLLDYVRAHDVSLIESLDSAPCCIWDIIYFDVRQGGTVALLMGEICTGRRL